VKIEGENEMPAPRDRVWAAFLDPATLAAAIPGCDALESIGPDEYKAVMKVGVGPIKGTFEGKVRLFDQEPPTRYRMAVEGTGAPGFVRGEAAMQLEEAGAGTRVRYDADVQVGGLIASVGQRMLGGAARLILDQFFGKMAELLAKRP
jgi:carbon monoxide dehydrogenase subunit G